VSVVELVFAFFVGYVTVYIRKTFAIFLPICCDLQWDAVVIGSLILNDVIIRQDVRVCDVGMGMRTVHYLCFCYMHAFIFMTESSNIECFIWHLHTSPVLLFVRLW
jgi:hypothetical protein